MKRLLLLLAIFAVVFNSCTTAYKTGQTPDDVYYSPARPQDDYVRIDKEEDKYKYRSDDEYYDDRYLRMKVRNYNRWNTLNDWYAYDRYSYQYNTLAPYWNFYGSYWNPYTSWNYYHNPYYYSSPVVWVITKETTPTAQLVKPRNFDLNGYTNNNFNNNNSFTKGNYRPATTTRPVYNNSNGTGFSNTLKQIFSSGNTNSYNNNSYSPSSRVYTPSTSSGSSGNNNSSSSGNSSGSGGGGVSRPNRGGN